MLIAKSTLILSIRLSELCITIYDIYSVLMNFKRLDRQISFIFVWHAYLVLYTRIYYFI